MKVLVVGWFSYEGYGATAGDLMARDVVLAWLREVGRTADVATAPPFDGGLRWHEIRPADYDDLVFVCGPFGSGPPIAELLATFAHCRLHGVDVSMLEPLAAWNPFDTLLERDSDRTARPDLSFLAAEPRVPVVGVILAHRQEEYGERALHEYADAAIARLLGSCEAARVPIDTRLDHPERSSRTPAEVESLIARMDVVVTTRLHGMALALKNGVPALAVDPVRGGAKVRCQARAVGWPGLVAAEDADDEAMARAFAFCLSDVARRRAAACAREATRLLSDAERRFKVAIAPEVPR